jgi:hypothetical protein
MATNVTTATDRRLVAAAGIVMVLGIIVLGPVMGGPDAFAGDAVRHYNDMLAGSPFLRAAPIRFGGYALLTAVELVFVAGLWSFVRQLAPRGIASPLVALSGAAFVAGGIASDAFTFGQMISMHAGNGAQPDGSLAAVADVSATLALIEVNVCLGVTVAVVSVVGLRTRALPTWMCWYGCLAAAASTVPGFAPTTEAVFIASNLLRLAFILAVCVQLLRGGDGRVAVAGGESLRPAEQLT